MAGVGFHRWVAKKFMCPVCAKKFQTQRGVNAHMRVMVQRYPMGPHETYWREHGTSPGKPLVPKGSDGMST
jgi:hypothetical protein